MTKHKDREKATPPNKGARGKLEPLHGLRPAAAARQRREQVAAHAAQMNRAQATSNTCPAWHASRIKKASEQGGAGASPLGAMIDGLGFAACARHALPRHDERGDLARLCREIVTPNGVKVEYVAALARRITRNWIQRMTRPSTLARAATRDGVANRPRLMAGYVAATQGAAAALDRRLFGVPGTSDTGDTGALDDAATAAKIAALELVNKGKSLYQGERLTLATYRALYRAVTGSYYKATGRGGREQLPGADMIEERMELHTGYRPARPDIVAARRLDTAALAATQKARDLRARARKHWSKSKATCAPQYLKKDLVSIRQAWQIALDRSEGHGMNSKDATRMRIKAMREKLAF